MKLVLILMAGWIVRWQTPLPAERAETGVASLLTRHEYERFFPHHDRLYSYVNHL